jgi:hypothetical protein
VALALTMAVVRLASMVFLQCSLNRKRHAPDAA